MRASAAARSRIATRSRRSPTRSSRSAPARSPAHLADHGIAPGDTVAILLPNSTQWVETCFAIARAGAISVPISYDATEPEIAYRLEDANCRAIVTTAERGDLVAKLKAGAPNLKTVIATDRGGTRSDALSLRDLLSTRAEVRAARSRR